MEGIFPARREDLWKLLWMHLDGAKVTAIHPSILSQRLVEQKGQEYLVDRTIRVGGRSRESRWRVSLSPPEAFRWEIVGGEGPMATGSRIENRYIDDPRGTLISTTAEIKLQGAPRLFEGRIVRRALGRIDEEDLAYLQRIPP